MKRIVLGLLIVAALLATGIWRWDQYRQVQSRNDLEQQVSRYWEAYLLNDQWTLYQLEAGRVEGALAPDTFYDAQLSSPVEIIGYSVNSIDMKGDHANISLDVEKTFPALRGGTFKGNKLDTWVRVEDQWLHDTPKTGGETGNAQDGLKAAAPPPPGHDAQPEARGAKLLQF